MDTYIPWDKSWIIRMGILDLVHGRSQIASFLSDEHAHLSDDLLALDRAITSWHAGKPIDVGESGTLYRLLQFTAWKQGLEKKFVTSGTLQDRPISSDPSIAHMPQEILLSLDNHTSQWASAAALNGDPLRIARPPFKLALTYLALEHWRAQTRAGNDWLPRRDETIQKQVEAYSRALHGEALDFVPEQAEDYCFARAFDIMTSEEGKKRWPALVGHETNRITEMETQLEYMKSGSKITSHDHRVVQAIAMLGNVRGQELSFSNPGCVRKSWPQFWEFLP